MDLPMELPARWGTLATSRAFLVEVFATFNLAFLSLDIFVAHSVNEFANPAEWIPFVFTIAGAVALLVALAMSAPLRAEGRSFREGPGRWIGVTVGVLAIVVGVTGLLLHLESDFFELLTLRSLVYSAPFVAPLAFTGIGLLLLANRMVAPDEIEWGQWVLLLAWAGFVGNFVLSLIDHAQNGFFYIAEWVPVTVAALVVGWLVLPIFRRTPRRHLLLGLGTLALAAATGVVGFVLHIIPVATERTGTLAERVVYGAPIFAPLLFPNLAILGALGVWDLLEKGWTSERAEEAGGAPAPGA